MEIPNAYVSVLVVAAMFGIWIWIVSRVCKDAEERAPGMGFLIGLLVFISGPFGLFGWLLLRPDQKSDDS